MADNQSLPSGATSPSQLGPASSSHRLPTVSASQALQMVQSPSSKAVSSNLPALDSLLRSGGFERARVTEVWGPSGSGKTALSLQTAIRAIDDGDHVMWVACAAPLSGTRLRSAFQGLGTASGVDTQRDESRLGHFHHSVLPSLAHFLAFILGTGVFQKPGVSLLVIDDLNTLIDISYPRHPAANLSSKHMSQDQRSWQSARRYAVLERIIQALKRLAVINNVAIIVTTGCATRMRGEDGLPAALGPGVGGAEWEKGVVARCALFRDHNGRFIGLQKAQGTTYARDAGDTGRILPFSISPATAVMSERYGEETNTMERSFDHKTHSKARLSPVKARKRGFDEVADSEEDEGLVDEYGWGAGDEDALTTGPYRAGFSTSELDEPLPEHKNVIEVQDD